MDKTGVKGTHHTPQTGVKGTHHTPQTGVKGAHHTPETGVKDTHPQTGVKDTQDTPQTGFKGTHHTPQTGVKGTHHTPQTGVKGTHHTPQTGVKGTHHTPQTGVKDTQNIPVSALHQFTLDQFSRLLDPEISAFYTKTGLYKNWRGLAELVSCSYDEIKELEGKDKKTSSLICFVCEKKGVSLSVSSLLDYIRELEREDVLRDEVLRKCLEDDIRLYKYTHNTDGAKQEEEHKNITIGEVTSGQPEYFDAFVCSHDNDKAFVEMLAEKLEDQNGFKLFIPNRNLTVGTAEYATISFIMENRCSSMLVVLSKDFRDCEKCNWMAKHWLSIASFKITIPIITSTEDDVPDYLAFIIPVRYCSDSLRWLERLKKSLLDCSTERMTRPNDDSTQRMTQPNDDSTQRMTQPNDDSTQRVTQPNDDSTQRVTQPNDDSTQRMTQPNDDSTQRVTRPNDDSTQRMTQPNDDSNASEAATAEERPVAESRKKQSKLKGLKKLLCYKPSKIKY